MHKEVIAAQPTISLRDPHPKLPWWMRFLIFLQEVSYLIAALEVGYVVYHYLAPWPIYRFVSFIVLVIVWSNLASATARQSVKKGKRGNSLVSLSRDTTAYLSALRKPRPHPPGKDVR